VRRLAVVLTLALAALCPGAARAAGCPAVTVPGAQVQKSACLDDLTTAGTVASGHTNVDDWEGLNASGTKNPSGVPGLQVDGYFPDDSHTNTNNGWAHDSQFVLRVPQHWNGKLIVTGAPGIRRQYANDFIISDWVLARGYAFASTDKGNTGETFYDDGGAPGDSVAEWNQRVTQLTVAAKAALKHVRRTYMMGISNGGYLTRYALEHHPELYDGGVDWEGTLFRPEGPNLLTYLPETLRSYPKYRATGDKAAHDRIIADGFAPGSEFLWDYHYAVYWDLTQRIYREEFDPGYDGALSAGIPFCQQGTPDCDANYDYASRPQSVKNAVAKVSNDGRIGKPMLTLQGDLDTLLPIRLDGQPYDRLVRAAGRGRLHRFYTIGKGNHVDDRYDTNQDKLRPMLPCARASLLALEGWVERREPPPSDQFVAKPGHGDVVNSCTLKGSPDVTYPAVPPRCLARSARLHSNGLGRVRVRRTRAAVLSRTGRASLNQARYLRYCVKGGGRVGAAFSKRGRVAFVGTTGSRHRAGARVHPGARLASARRGYRRIARGLYRRGRIVFGTRRGRLTFVAAVDRSLVHKPRRLRAYRHLARM
jgi:hypothetical protein